MGLNMEALKSEVFAPRANYSPLESAESLAFTLETAGLRRSLVNTVQTGHNSKDSGQSVVSTTKSPSLRTKDTAEVKSVSCRKQFEGPR